MKQLKHCNVSKNAFIRINVFVNVIYRVLDLALFPWLYGNERNNTMELAVVLKKRKDR